jgi:hypothetical protein
MVAYSLPSYDAETLASRIKCRHYDIVDAAVEQDGCVKYVDHKHKPQDLNENDVVSDPLHLAFKLLASSRIHEVPEYPDATDEKEKKKMKIVANSRESESIYELDLGNAPPAAHHEIKRLLGKDVDLVKFSTPKNPFYVMVHEFCGVAIEVVIYKDLEDLNEASKIIKFPAKHLWKFSAEKKHKEEETFEPARVKWALSHVPGYLGWSARESWDLKSTFGQEIHFKLIDQLQFELDKGRKDKNVIDFVYDNDKKAYSVVWPDSLCGESYIFPVGMDGVSKGAISPYKTFLKEFVRLVFRNVDDFTLLSLLRVLIYHHCKVDAFLTANQARGQFEEIRVIGSVVSAHLNYLKSNNTVKKWVKYHFEELLPHLGKDIQEAIFLAREDERPSVSVKKETIREDSQDVGGTFAGPSTSGAKRSRPIEWDDSDSES